MRASRPGMRGKAWRRLPAGIGRHGPVAILPRLPRLLNAYLPPLCGSGEPGRSVLIDSSELNHPLPARPPQEPRHPHHQRRFTECVGLAAGPVRKSETRTRLAHGVGGGETWLGGPPCTLSSVDRRIPDCALPRAAGREIRAHQRPARAGPAPRQPVVGGRAPHAAFRGGDRRSPGGGA